MIKIYIKNKYYKTVKNWDTALHECAKQYKNGIKINEMKIINTKTQTELPVKIHPFTFFKR